MKIFTDKQKLINIHPLVIYFVIPSHLYANYDNKLEGLNRYKSFTRGVFKFKTIAHLNEYAIGISPSLEHCLGMYNMMVRLVDDANDCFHYAFHRLKLSDPYEKVEKSIHEFIDKVCEENIKLLSGRKSLYSTAANDPTYRQMVVEQMLDVFKNAISPQQKKYGILNRIDQMASSTRCVSEIGMRKGLYNYPQKAVDKLRNAGFSTNDAKLAAKLLWQIVEEEFNTPNKTVSDQIATGMVNKEYSSHVRREQTSRIKPSKELNVSAEIKLITTKVLSNGKEKKQWGTQFRANDKCYPIYFGSKYQTMIYVCTLLRQKLNERMYIHEFYNNSKGHSCKFQRFTSKNWLREVFNKLFSAKDVIFDKWMTNIQDKSGRPLNQGKSQANKKINNIFDELSDGNYYCGIKTKQDKLGNSYYHVDIKSENIIVPEEMQFLLDKMYDIMKKRPPQNTYTYFKE